MKKLIVALSLLSIIACKNKENENNSEPSLMESVESVNKLSKAANDLKEYQKQTEKLKTTEPVKNEVYKEVLTETFENLKRINYTAGNAAMVGLSSAEATYGDQAGKNIKINIFDGAGESGSALIAVTHMAIAMDMESIDNTTTKKTEVIDGIRAQTENDTNPDAYKSSSITYIYNDRFQVSLEGQKIPLDELKSYMKKLQLSKLD